METETSQITGHLILICGPAGSGKSVLIKYLEERYPHISKAVSCTTRPMRPGEVEGEIYYFVDEKTFKEKIDNGEFLEWIQQDGGKYYGTLKSEILSPLIEGKIVLREVEMKGVKAIRSIIPDDAMTVIFVDAGEWENLRERIQARAPITGEELQHRKERYERERLFIGNADVVIENTDDIAVAQKSLCNAVDTIIKQTQTT
jgi:guanylate kinase